MTELILLNFFFAFFALSLADAKYHFRRSYSSDWQNCPIKAGNQTFNITKQCILLSVPEDLLIEDQSDSYETENYQWIKYKQKHPKVFIKVNNVSQIQQIVRCAKKNNYPLAVRGGGHSYEKYSYGDHNSIVIDVRNLKNMSIDTENKTISIQAGALLGEVYYYLWENGQFGIPAGACPLVGIAGHSMGGGLGYFNRKYGVLSDNLIEIHMVNIKGKLVVANENVNEELFWALRGAGKGNFGIVTQLIFRIFDASRNVTLLEKTFSDPVLGFLNYQRWVLSNPSNLVSSSFLSQVASSKATFFIQPDSETERTSIINSINDFFNENVNNSNSTDTCENITFISMVIEFAALEGVNKPSDLLNLSSTMMQQMYFHAKSHFISNDLSEENVETLFNEFAMLPDSYRMIISQQGGAIDESDVNKTSYIHRKQLFLMQLAKISTEDPDKTPMNKFDAKTHFLYGNESFQNYIDEDMPNALEKYYGAHLHRLKEIKRKYDPDHFFCFPLSL